MEKEELYYELKILQVRKIKIEESKQNEIQMFSANIER